MEETEKTTYSYHHFFFPFKWDVLNEKFDITDVKENLEFDERTSFKDFNTLLGNENWESKPFDINNNAESYNQYTYFHSFVRKSIFYTIEQNLSVEEEGKNQILRYYEYKKEESKRCFYYIKYLSEIKKNSQDQEKQTQAEYEEKEIQLILKGITLHILNTGVGILSFNLANNKYRNPTDILIINEIGRRIYPQFLGIDGKIRATQEAFLAVEIKIENLKSDPIIENFANYDLEKNNIDPHKTFLPPAHIRELFSHKNLIFHLEEKLDNKKILLSRVMDDRMFFLCWYGNKYLTNSANARCFKNWDWWYAFVFGDKISKSIANSQMQEDHLQKHTYPRWSGYGTLYGMSRDSFVCLSPDQEILKSEKGIPRFDIQMNTMYYQIAVLCLAQRGSILKFSGEISNLSDWKNWKADKSDKQFLQRVKNVYGNYLEFRNKIYFKEITSQIQGIEIYEQFQAVMNIPNELQVLEEKIRALHEFLSLEEAEDMNREMHRLTWIAILFLPASFVASLFGISFISNTTGFMGEPQWNVWIAWIIIGIIFLLSIIIMNWFKIFHFCKRLIKWSN